MDIKNWKIFGGYGDLIATARLEGGLIHIQSYKDDKLAVYFDGKEYLAEGTLEGAIAIMSTTNNPMDLDPVSITEGTMSEDGTPDAIVKIGYINGRPRSFNVDGDLLLIDPTAMARALREV